MPKIYKRNCNYCGEYYENQGKYFCSRKCYNNNGLTYKTKKKISKSCHGGNSTSFKKGQNIGKDNYNWKGGIVIDNDGYINIHKHKHPFCKKSGYILEHRFIAEKCLERYLTKLEVIHHINEIKSDNRPENLYLFPDLYSHSAYHTLLKNNLIELITKSNLL